MKLPQPNDREKQVLRSLAESGEGTVLVGYMRRLVASLTNTRNLGGDDIAIQVEAANKASDIIEETLIRPLSRQTLEPGTYERLD